MGQIFCALVLFFVIISVEGWSTRKSSETNDTLCSENHPLNPYIKLFNVIPEEWKSENNIKSPEKHTVCFTKVITTEIDENGKELNTFSSYEITFGIPKKYQNTLASQASSENDGHEFKIYDPFEENSEKNGVITTNKVYVRCSKKHEHTSNGEDGRRSGTTLLPETTTINHDLDFMNDLDEICEEHLDIDILNTLPSDDVTPESEYGNTRRNGNDFLDYTTDKIDKITTTETPNDTSTIQPEQNGILSPFLEITTEITDLITQILNEANTSTETTTTSFEVNENDTKATTKLPDTTETVVTEVKKELEVVTEEVRRSEDFKAFIIQKKKLFSPDLKPQCYFIKSNIKYGKCTKPIIPIRILTESKLPKIVNLELVEDLENSKDDDEILVSGQQNCYLLKYLSNVECPRKMKNTTTILEIDDLPDNPNDEPFFTIELNKKCTAISKNVDIIECPLYHDTLPHIRTEHLPDHVRLKHSPGVIDVDTDDIIVHSFSHCLLLRAVHNIDCNGKPNIILNEDEMSEHFEDETQTTEIYLDEENYPTYRFGDYSLEKQSNIKPKAFDNNKDSDENKLHSTTPCKSDEDEDSDPINRSTRTLLNPTTETPGLNRKLIYECNENDADCLTEKTASQENYSTNEPEINNTEPTTIEPSTTSSKPIEVTEIHIPNSRKLSQLLKTIVNESTDKSQNSDLFKPDFMVKVGCANQISKSSCFYISKYIMKPTFDDDHEYNYLMDKELLPGDAKFVSAPNLNIFEANETLYTLSGKEKYVLIKKENVDCPSNKIIFFILDTGSCSAERRDDNQDSGSIESSIVKYQKGKKIYCFDFDDDLRIHQVKCPEDLTNVPVLSRPEDLKTLCRSQLKNKGHNEQMKLLRRLNIVTDHD